MDNDMYIVTRYMSLVRMALRCNYTYVIFYLMFSCHAAFFEWRFAFVAGFSNAFAWSVHKVFHVILFELCSGIASRIHSDI